MSAKLVDGKALAAEIQRRLAGEAQAFKGITGFAPGLAVILIGDDPASKIYVRNKEKACAEAGFFSEGHYLPASTAQEEIDDLIMTLNADPKIHGVLVQWPVPGHIDYDRVIGHLDPMKDADGFHPLNTGRLLAGKPGLVPCTPRGIMELLAAAGVDPAGKNAVVVGRSNIVGRPMALLLLHANATVTVCHSRTTDLAAETRRADILVAAAGRPRLIQAPMVKEGAVVIDVGMNREDGKLMGDVDFEAVREKAGAITPVPGGVGPMTIAMLLANTLDAARNLTGVG